MTALLLAVLAWYGFQPADLRPSFLPTPRQPFFTRHLVAHPVTISKPATDPREFKVTPSEVEITLSGKEDVLRALSAGEVRAEVWTTEYKENTNQLSLHISVPPGGNIALEKLSPKTVQVEVVKE